MKVVRPSGLVFDFDQTLVDTRELLPYREKRLWSEIQLHIHKARPYAGIHELLDFLKENRIKFSIVSNAPREVYIEPILKCFSIEVPSGLLIGYHDVRNRKPHPEPFLLAASRMLAAPNECWCIGDRNEDMVGGKRAGMLTIAALWGGDSELRSEHVDVFCYTPEDIKRMLVSCLNETS